MGRHDEIYLKASNGVWYIQDSRCSNRICLNYLVVPEGAPTIYMLKFDAYYYNWEARTNETRKQNFKCFFYISCSCYVGRLHSLLYRKYSLPVRRKPVRRINREHSFHKSTENRRYLGIQLFRCYLPDLE